MRKRNTQFDFGFQVLIVLCLFAFCAGLSARANALGTDSRPRWFRVADVAQDNVTIEWHSVDARTLRAQERKWTNVHIPGTKAITRLLRRGNTYHCIVYHIAGAADAVIEHELRHCHGWEHN